MNARHRVASDSDQRARLLRAAASYMKWGMVVTPNKASTTKAAYLPAWGQRRLSLPELAAELDRPGKGIGVVLGDASRGLVDVDLDHPAAVTAADALLPPTRLVSGRTCRPRTHRFYRSAGAPTAAFKAGATGMIAELRAAGCQTVLPPSPHPEGGYHWDSWGEPDVVDAGLLRRLTGQVAAAAFLMAVGWPVERALAFAREPDSADIARWERCADGCPALGAWLSPPPSLAPCSSARSSPGCTGPSASPYTRAVLQRVGDVVGAARLLGLELREGHQACPWHRSRGARSLQVTGAIWRCHAGCGSGNAIHLAARALAVSYREARGVLAGLLGLSWQGSPGGGGVKRLGRCQPRIPASGLNEAGGRRRAERGANA